MADLFFLLGDRVRAVRLGLPDGGDLCTAGVAPGCQSLQILFQCGFPADRVLGPLFQRVDLALCQLCILLAGQLLQPLCAQLVGQCFLLGKEGVAARMTVLTEFW